MTAAAAVTATQIRVAMAAALKTISGLQASAWTLANPTPPSAHVMRGPVEYDQAFQGGTHLWTMRVQAFVALVTDIGAQQRLDDFLSPEGSRSIKAALEQDTTLGGIVQSLHVTDASGEQVYVRENGGPVLGSEWTVEVWL